MVETKIHSLHPKPHLSLQKMAQRFGDCNKNQCFFSPMVLGSFENSGLYFSLDQSTSIGSDASRLLVWLKHLLPSFPAGLFVFLLFAMPVKCGEPFQPAPFGKIMFVMSFLYCFGFESLVFSCNKFWKCPSTTDLNHSNPSIAPFFWTTGDVMAFFLGTRVLSGLFTPQKLHLWLVFRLARIQGFLLKRWVGSIFFVVFSPNFAVHTTYVAAMQL